MQAEVTDIVKEAERLVGLRMKTPTTTLEVRADLVVAADGRQSIVREKAGLPVQEFGAPMDVLWFRLSRKRDDTAQTMGRFDTGRIFIMINRGEYWQCGYVIPKGQFDEIRKQGLESFRETIGQLAPHARDQVNELKSWDDIKLLTVRVDRLSQWFRPGLLCIGDAAHAMSPVGGVGINLAIQDAVAAANILAAPLRDGRPTLDQLRRVQKRRELPTRITQWLQVTIQRRLITPALAGARPLKPPLAVRLLARFALLRRIPARLGGIGLRPEPVRAPLPPAETARPHAG